MTTCIQTKCNDYFSQVQTARFFNWLIEKQIGTWFTDLLINYCYRNIVILNTEMQHGYFNTLLNFYQCLRCYII